MSRFYSYSGSSPTNSDSGGKYAFRGPDGRIRQGYRGPIPDMSDHPQLREFYEGQAETSHNKAPTDVGENYWHVNAAGEKVAAKVLHEEKDQHTGKIEQIIQTSSQTGSGTRKVVWSPGADKRQIVIESNRPTTD